MAAVLQEQNYCKLSLLKHSKKPRFSLLHSHHNPPLRNNKYFNIATAQWLHEAVQIAFLIKRSTRVTRVCFCSIL